MRGHMSDRHTQAIIDAILDEGRVPEYQPPERVADPVEGLG